MAVDRFCRNDVGPPEWECEAMVLWCGYSVLTSAECVFNLSIGVSSVMRTVRSRSHNGSTVIIMMCLITTPVR